MRTHGWVLGWCVHVRRFKSCLLNHVESEHILLTLVGVVWRQLGLDMTFREISRHLQISTSTAHRIYRKFEETGDVSPVRHNRCPDHRKLDDHHEFLLIAIVMENPCLHLHEMCSQILHTTGVQVSGSTVCHVLQRNGFTRKKKMWQNRDH